MKTALLFSLFLVNASSAWGHVPSDNRPRTAHERYLIRNLERFFDKWAAHDVDGIANSFARDAIYHNVPFHAPITGRENIRALFDSFFPAFGYIDLGAYHFIVDGNVIAVERVDTFEVIPTGKTAVFEIAGVFHFDRYGKITRWNDYYDAKTFEKQTGMQLPE